MVIEFPFRVCEIGGGRPLTFPFGYTVGYNKKAVLAHSCRYRACSQLGRKHLYNLKQCDQLPLYLFP